MLRIALQIHIGTSDTCLAEVRVADTSAVKVKISNNKMALSKG